MLFTVCPDIVAAAVAQEPPAERPQPLLEVPALHEFDCTLKRVLGKEGYGERISRRVRTTRLWLMPTEIVESVRALANLRALPDETPVPALASRSDPSPGWRTLPEW